jgi:effector-binding domain-containing protein
MLRLSLTLSLVMSLAGAAAAQEEGARAVLEKVVADMGGDAALAGVRGMRTTYSGTYEGMPYRSEMLWVAPDHALLHVDAGPAFEGRMGLDGDVAWSAFGAPLARLRGAAKEALADWPVHMQLLLVRPVLRNRAVIVQSGPSVKSGRMTLEHVLLTYPGGKKFDLTVRIEDGVARLVHVAGDMLHMDGRRGTMRWDLLDHAKLGSIVLPTRVRTQTFVGDRRVEDMTERLVSVEWNPEVSDDAFARPPLPPLPTEPAVRDAPPLTGLVTIHHGPPAELRESIVRLYRVCQERGLMTMGGVAVTMLGMAPGAGEDAGMEVLLPVMIMGAPPKDLPEDVRLATREGGRVAVLPCRGPYGTADVAALETLEAWVKKQGRAKAGPPTILYHHDPSVTVPEDQQAEVRVPVR